MIIKGTSCYNNVKKGNLVSVTVDGGMHESFMEILIK